MGSKGLLVFSAAMMTAPCLAAYAQDTGHATPSLPDKANGTSKRTDAINALRLSPLPPRPYDGNAIPGQNGFVAPPVASTLRIIDAGGLMIELRSDGLGHRALTSPFLKGLGVGGEVRRGGGVFRFSWQTSN